MKLLFQLKHFLLYQWHSQTKYYIHSPFVYQFYLNVLEGDVSKELQPLINLRRQLAANDTRIDIKDLGTGKDKTIAISAIENSIAVRHKYGQVLYRLVRYFSPTHVIELGTSIGISSAYMALAAPQAAVFTLEGAHTLADAARQNHQQLGISNVAVIKGNFKDTLPALLGNTGKVGLVFFDGNHTEQATMQYFEWCIAKADEDSIFVFDDIYWSEGMNAAWQCIKQDQRITLTIDVYQFGICFFKKGKTKEDFILRY